MEPSATYIAIQDMIQHGLLGILFPDFTKALSILEEKGLITEAEGKVLLTLANQLTEDHLSHSWPPRPGPYFPISGETDSIL